MSRLYAWINSDTNKSAKTITGNERIEISVNWGSVHDSKKACYVSVYWLKSEDQPRVYIQKAVGLDGS